MMHHKYIIIVIHNTIILQRSFTPRKSSSYGRLVGMIYSHPLDMYFTVYVNLCRTTGANDLLVKHQLRRDDIPNIVAKANVELRYRTCMSIISN